MKHRLIGYTALITGCALPVLLLLGLFFLGEKEVSVSENRALARFPAFSLSSFASGEFQTDLEDALSDQYPWGEEIKDAVLKARNGIAKAESAALTALFPAAQAGYTEITPGYYHFAGDEHRIVEKPWNTETQRLEENAAAFNAAENVKKYIYFIRNSRSQDFTKSDAENDEAYQRVRSACHADGWGCFAAADYEEYCRLFYQTDHHWNCRGADRGYREILALLGLEKEALAPEKEWTFDAVFNGSYARQTKALCADEKFSAYTYPLEEITVILSGKKGRYGHASLYENNRFPTDALRNHYAYYYGGDYGEILIDSGRETGRNLLLIADSYSNPLNLLLAHHFDRTSVIDLRYYQRDMGAAFDLDAYARAHDMDTVLMLGDIAFFAGAQDEEAGN